MTSWGVLSRWGRVHPGSWVKAAAPTPHFLVIQNIHDLDKFPADTTDFGIFVGSPAVGTEATGAKEHLGTASRARLRFELNATQRIRARNHPAEFLVRGDKVINIQGKDRRHAV